MNNVSKNLIKLPRVPRHALDLVSLPKLPGSSIAAQNLAQRIEQTHREVRQNITETNAKNKAAADRKRREKVFEVGELVMRHLGKSRFPVGTYDKLNSKKYGHVRISKKISDNAYVVELPVNFNISNTFNVSDIYSYNPEAPIYVTEGPGENSSKVEEHDGGPSTRKKKKPKRIGQG